MTLEILPPSSENPAVPEFVEFPSIARLSREVVVTEKLDGTNAQVLITDEGKVFAGSRTRWVAVGQDNHGWAGWVTAHRQELLALGPGSHFGEWWGSGIQRGYGLTKGEKRFSLFNVGRWIASEADRTDEKQGIVPACCRVVPVLHRGIFDTQAINNVLLELSLKGSVAAPGFMDPEGIVVYHEKSRALFKKTLGDDGHKGAKGA